MLILMQIQTYFRYSSLNELSLNNSNLNNFPHKEQFVIVINDFDVTAQARPPLATGRHCTVAAAVMTRRGRQGAGCRSDELSAAGDTDQLNTRAQRKK